MSSRISERLAPSIPLCASNGTARTNGTCIDQVDQLFQAFSSTVVLFVLIAMITGIIFVSLTTFHFHKRKMKKRKIQKAQEEYERDNCSPKTGKPKPVVRQCIMERPGKRAPPAVQKSDPNTPATADYSNPAIPDTQLTPANDSTENTRHTGQTHGDHFLESVAVSR